MVLDPCSVTRHIIGEILRPGIADLIQGRDEVFGFGLASVDLMEGEYEQEHGNDSACAHQDELRDNSRPP
jgi:hypothetical protein